jgi:hypothetical protein
MGRWGGRDSEKSGVRDAKPFTPKTLKYRAIARAQEDPERNPTLKRFVDKQYAAYNTQEAWARRKAATNPANFGKLRFGSEGQLLNRVDAAGNLLD